ncbi:RNA-binding protein 41-like [Babylonia areolata]|uniref:RNA-binding protein 41-like n=1 Tax=Babylonia areolata TaxID=304850 RepID=UPI003FD50520
MFKRKRLYDRKDTYRDTGIPCGNPKRVRTGEVLCMPSASSSATAQMTESLQTQGEEQLRVMAQKQLNTKVTIQELSSQHRQFTEAGRYKPVLKEVKGVLKLQEYRDIAKGDERMEKLRQCGLTDDEIRLQLGRERLETGQLSAGTNKGTYGAHPEIQEEQLRAIDGRIKEKEKSLAVPDTFRGLKQISRQEMDIEKSMFYGTNRDSDALTNLLTEKKKDVTGDPNDPINQLPQLMADIEERARENFKEKRRRRRRNRKQCVRTEVCNLNVNDAPNEENSDEEQGGIIGCLTFEEMQALKLSEKATADSNTKTVNTSSENDPQSSESASNRTCINKQYSQREDSGSNQNPTGTNNRECVVVEGSDAVVEAAAQNDRKVLKGPIEFIPVEYIEENRLNLEQIKQLPKFANYEAGNPSSVLYVKNLSPRSSEQDLVSLFGRFQKKAESHIVYRLMTGRMRGQAFVTFDNSEVATQALQLVNGFLLHEKPVIVQYGRRTTA